MCNNNNFGQPFAKTVRSVQQQDRCPVSLGVKLVRKSVKSSQKKQNFDSVAVSLSLLRGTRPKSARASDRQCSQSPPNFMQIGL